MQHTHTYNEKMILDNIEFLTYEPCVYMQICDELVELFFQKDSFYKEFRWEIDCKTDTAYIIDDFGMRTAKVIF